MKHRSGFVVDKRRAITVSYDERANASRWSIIDRRGASSPRLKSASGLWSRQSRAETAPGKPAHWERGDGGLVATERYARALAVSSHPPKNNPNCRETSMIDFSPLEVWFLTGSQHLYGPDTLSQVESDSREIVNALN